MYVYFLKNDEDMGNGHILKKGKVMATSEEDVISHDFYNVVQLSLTQQQIEKQGFLYIIDGKPFINEEEYKEFLTNQNTEQSLQQRINILEKELNAIKTLQLDYQIK